MNRILRTWRAGGGLTVLAFVLLASPGAQAHAFGDDYGDTPALATNIAVGSNVTGRLEIDVDQDWFKFPVQSLTQYTVSVRTNTLWNSTLTLVWVDGLTSMAYTDSVSSATATISRVYIGPPATWYAGVAGFAQFTTGTYTLAVTANSLTDANHDGMPDSWEVNYFGTTNVPPYGDADTDGVANVAEYVAGTDPMNPLSRLAITAFNGGSNTASLSWSSQPYRFYQVEGSTNLLSTNWTFLSVVTNANTAGLLNYTEAPATNSPRFYRVECLY